jgi:O-antigen ligase
LSWKGFVENPILGVGPGQLANVIERHGGYPGANAHNTVLNTLGELGITAGGVLLFMLSLVIIRSWRKAWNERSAFAVAVCVSVTTAAIHNFVESSYAGEQFQVVFWAVAALLTTAKPERWSLPNTQFDDLRA